MAVGAAEAAVLVFCCGFAMEDNQAVRNNMSRLTKIFAMHLLVSPRRCWRLAMAQTFDPHSASRALGVMAFVLASVVWMVAESVWHLRFTQAILDLASVAVVALVFWRVFQCLHLPLDTKTGLLRRSCLVVAPFFVIWVGTGTIILLVAAALKTVSDRFPMHWPMLLMDILLLPGLLFHAIWTARRTD
jgi:hypothetical protein